VGGSRIIKVLKIWFEILPLLLHILFVTNPLCVKELKNNKISKKLNPLPPSPPPILSILPPIDRLFGILYSFCQKILK
jgi:hypothetical protein